MDPRRDLFAFFLILYSFFFARTLEYSENLLGEGGWGEFIFKKKGGGGDGMGCPPWGGFLCVFCARGGMFFDLIGWV